MKRLIVQLTRAVVALTLLSHSFFSQDSVGVKPSFEAVSIKPNVSGSGSSGTSTNQGRLRATNVTLKMLIMNSYRVQDFQVIGGPDWIDTARFDVQAKAEDGAIPETRNQRDDPNRIGPLELMMQSMLADRFQLRLAHETRELPVYTLTIAKEGAKIKPVAVDSNPAEPAGVSGADRGPAGGAPAQGAVGAGGMSTNVSGTKGEMNANTVPLSRFVQALSRQLRRPVIDQTNLKEMYTIHLEWAPDTLATGGNRAGADAPIADPAGPSLFTAIQEQLGLKLNSAKGPVEVLVIRSVEKPSDN
jgi:uncharacterized protein (TIGR03435 family)